MEFSFNWIVNILIAIYLVVDSKKHGKSPILWGIMGFIFGLIALSIYLIRTGRKTLGWILLVVSVLIYLLVFFVIIAAFLFYVSAT
ncbi:MAG TPA: hypothetical protein VNR61_08945 [Niallia sp.]|nr:hypothetical protein [Niallia sp.]